MIAYISFASALTFVAVTQSYTRPPHLVDLGYAKHVPTWTNITPAGTELLNYNNIRYAQTPYGELRFRKPKTPPSYERGYQNGDRTSWVTDCISSAHPGVPFPLINGSTWGSEDCLFLNVIKPKNAKEGDKLPVLHWVVGSAYSFGGKDWTGFGMNTYGLFNRPMNLTDQFIIVTHNYRLGTLGWLPKLEDDMNGNVGVWDTLSAIKWTKEHIHKFGGDANRITAIGQSAGAGILTWLLLSEEGTLTLPFEQAWISSPAIPPRYNLERSRTVFDFVLNATGCDNVECMRKVPESTIRTANKLIMGQVPSAGGGSLGLDPGFTPTVDGELVSELPAAGFAHGKINEGIKKLVVATTAFEGLGLSSDYDMPSRFPDLVRANIPNASSKSIATLLSTYNFSPDRPEKLAWDYVTDIVFGCTALNIVQAYRDRARQYLFSVPPATHGMDLSCEPNLDFFYADNATTPVVNLETALSSESYLLQFIFGEDLKALGPESDLSEWPVYGEDEIAANITAGGYTFGPLAKEAQQRCAYINEMLMDPQSGV
ncbi:uncharacterized protein N0V89_012526 [Didymosphaeria variabile]|uniref:Carboxylesterase type B domain-containing protein n=1 Tax=Didymosphaeria variabile TaxID=1932322 RepID=A0A9W8XAP5_9PLEO|nr:uncharacterized protein N0V89_012526 [Didymosphaeria variabile]KAJ4344782.1 hypothetical protein N0V89_012526 [Didymosphaeria variabile]